MEKHYTFLLLFVITTLNVFSQKNKKAEDSYTSFFTLPREALHLHLNKTTYLSGEEIWFKGYAYDQKNQLTSTATTNFNIGIYDATGKEVKRALFKGENGVTSGNFLIDSTFTTGTYYIKATTNWMKNFRDDGAYIQKINICVDKITSNYTEKTLENTFDFQFLPEGGHIVTNTQNNIGFKVTDTNGKGTKTTGIIYNENGEEITKFSSNHLGFGKFLFEPKAGQKYTSKITFNSGETFTQQLPSIKQKGVSMILNNLFPDKVIIKLNTNKETLKKIKGETYKLLIHQSGKLKQINFTFDEGTSKTISISKKELFKGINTLTLFDKNEQPLLERLFFNEKYLKKPTIVTSPINTINDTILLSVSELNLESEANISISILPEETESYAPDNNIISSFLLKPYLKGTIENPQYYFTKFDRKQQYELDILLLTQGWSKYHWNEIFNNPPKQQHRFENGITLRGKVNLPTTGVDRLFIYATANHPAQFIDLQKDQSFVIQNLYLEKNEKIRFSYIDKRGTFKKPKMFVAFNVTNEEDAIEDVEQITYKKVNPVIFNAAEKLFIPDSEELDAVVIEAKKEKDPKEPLVIAGRFTKVTLDVYHQYPFLADYIQNNGYRVIESFGTVTIESRNKFTANGGTPLVMLDDVPLSDLSILYQFSMANVEKILIDKLGFEAGIRGAGGVIKIYSRTTPLIDDVNVATSVFNENVATYAFEKEKKFYTPKYRSYKSDLFKKYGVISWVPEIKLKKNETLVIKIPETKTKLITVYIEGITKEGNLICQKKVIDIGKLY